MSNLSILRQGHNFEFSENDFFHLISLFWWNRSSEKKSNIFQQFKKNDHKKSKKNGLDFLNSFCVLWALGIHPNWWEITEKLIHKTRRMKYGPHFWLNMHQNWQNLSKMSWLTLAHGLWWVLLPKIVKTDPKNEIRVRQNSGKVIVLT